MTRTWRSAVGAMVLFFAGAALAQDAAGPTGSELFPLKKGSKWVYKAGDQTVEVVVGTTEKEATKLDTVVNGKTVATETVQVKADGVYRLTVKGDKIDPPVKFLALPIKKAESWDVNAKVGTQSLKGKFTLKDDKEKVKVPAGEFEAVRVDGPDFEIAGTKTKISYWFVKDKGVVKLTYDIAGSPGGESVLELKEYVEGK